MVSINSPLFDGTEKPRKAQFFVFQVLTTFLRSKSVTFFLFFAWSLEGNIGKPQIPPKKHSTHSSKEVQGNA